jgi:hypothetical protein
LLGQQNFQVNTALYGPEVAPEVIAVGGQQMLPFPRWKRAASVMILVPAIAVIGLIALQAIQQHAQSSDGKTITGAVIAAAASLLAAVISAAVSFFTARKAAMVQRELEEFKDQIGEKTAERNARRSYEYDARQRLYREYEPLRFQLGEAAEAAYSRILSLARSARNGDLRADGGWNSGEGYYLRSTVYKLLLPMAIFRLMQRNLTLVDTRLVAEVATQYRIAKGLYYSWTDEFELARLPPPIRYTPHAEVSSEVRATSPAVFVQQGIPTGYLDRSVDALLTLDESKIMRIIYYGAFETAFRDVQSESHKSNVVLVNALTNFHPLTRPVLWRVLVAQTCMYRLLAGASPSALVDPPEETRRQFDWRRSPHEAPDESVLKEPFEVASRYLQAHGLLGSSARPIWNSSL